MMYLGLGGNLGNRYENLAVARGLCYHFFGPLARVSPVFESAAWGETDQPDFLNQVISVATDVKPEVAIYTLLAIENLMGRIRTQRWGPRVIDVDMLFYADQQFNTPDLQLPHPRLAERRFVLAPLVEIAPGLVDPRTGRTSYELLQACPDPAESVWLYAGPR